MMLYIWIPMNKKLYKMFERINDIKDNAKRMYKEHQAKCMSIPQLLSKLDEMYEKEEKIRRMLVATQLEYEQLQEDKELLQNVIMHQSNKISRMRDL